MATDRYEIEVEGSAVKVVSATGQAIEAFTGTDRLLRAIGRAEELNAQHAKTTDLTEAIHRTTAPLDEALTGLVDAWVAYQSVAPDVGLARQQASFYASMLNGSAKAPVFLMQAIVRLADLRAGVPGVTP